MKVLIDTKVLDGKWWFKGCAVKLLLYLVDKARLLHKPQVEFNRRVVANDLGETEWAVRTAFDQLKQKGIILPITAQRKVGTTVGFTGDYICFAEDTLPNPAQSKGKKKASSPKSRPNPAQMDNDLTANVSGASGQSDGVDSPNNRPNTARQKDKEITKENFPHTPYIENNKETECPNGRLAPGPVGPPPLNQRARLCFEEVYRRLYNAEYYWSAKDAGQMTQLLNKIRFSREKRQMPLPTDDDSMIKALQQFLTSINKDWISNNFSVSVISSHYNEIISELKNSRTNGRQISTDSATLARRSEIAANVLAYDEQWQREHSISGSTGK